MQKFDTTNKAIIYVENGIFNKQAIESLMSKKKPILKVKMNVDGKDLEIPFWFKMQWDDAKGDFSNQFFVTSTGNKMLKGEIGEPYVTKNPENQETDTYLTDQGKDADEANNEDDIPF